MSGCYPGETLSMCIHGTPAKLTCAQCSNEHRLNLIESQIKALTEMYKNLSIKVASFEDHRIRQIDENRKISRRVDDVESKLQIHWDDREYFYESIKKLNFENDELKKRIQICEHRIDEIEDGLIKRLGILGEALHEMSEENHRLRKSPHKCPNCKGNGKIQGQKFSSNYQSTHFFDCLSCDGKGIIWG